MRRREFLLSTGAALSLSAFPLHWTPAAAAEGKKQKLLYFTRSAGFEHAAVKRDGDKLSISERTLTEMGSRAGFDVVCTKDGRVFDEDLDQFNAIAFYTSGVLTEPDQNPSANNGADTKPMSVAGKKRLLDAVAAGKGFVAIHAATDSFHTAGAKNNETQAVVDPYIAMVGGEFIVHGKQQDAALKIVSPNFPGVKGLESPLKYMEEWYTLKNFAKDLHVILVQETQGMEGDMYQRPPFPATWARMHEKGRVFHTTFGHRDDIWTNPVVQQIMLGGIAWVMRNVDADVTPNIDQVTPGANQLAVITPKPPKAKKNKKKK